MADLIDVLPEHLAGFIRLWLGKFDDRSLSFQGENDEDQRIRREIDLPDGWEGRIWKAPESSESGPTAPTLHAANFSLPLEDADFGSTALASMGSDGMFLAITEYGLASAGQGIFAPGGISLPIVATLLSDEVLQVMRPGQAGLQRFFTI